MEYDSDSSYEPEEDQKQSVEGSYKPRNVLKPPLTGPYSVEALWKWILNSEIQLEPE